METQQSRKTHPFKINSDWAGTARDMQAKYPTLTNTDLNCIAGQEEEMLSRVGAKLSRTRVEVINRINVFKPSKR